MSSSLLRHRFTVRDYHAMIASGIFRKEDRVELIEGEILDMSPIDSRHSGCVSALTELLLLAVEGRATLTSQNPVILGDLSEPEPDLLLLKRREDFYREAHPVPVDVFLLVEVAASSLSFDRKVKRPLYARSGIREYWIVDLEAAEIEVHRAPVGETYTEIRRVASGSIGPEALDGVEIDAGRVLGT